MKGLPDSSLPVIVATTLASVMILVAGNGVADAVKKTEETAVQDLAPPGPFGLSGSDSAAVSDSSSQAVVTQMERKLPEQGVQSTAKMPVAPNMPTMKVAPQLVATSLVAPKPLANGSVLAAEPVLKMAQPNTSKALEAPVNLMNKPLAPVGSNIKMSPSIAVSARVNPQYVIKSPVAPVISSASMPQFITPIQPMRPPQPMMFHPQQNMPTGAIAPKLQKYRYVPLPVIKSNYNYQQLPKQGGSFPVPGYYWVPQNSIGVQR